MNRVAARLVDDNGFSIRMAIVVDHKPGSPNVFRVPPVIRLPIYTRLRFTPPEDCGLGPSTALTTKIRVFHLHEQDPDGTFVYREDA